MESVIRPQIDKRLVLAVALITAIATTFWVGSRVPALNEKAAMSGDLLLPDPLSFNVALLNDSDDSGIKKIAYTTINWINTNKQGMTFGVLLAAALMTALSLLGTRSFSGNFSNSALGVVLGAPLGVCVNCAAPIAQGMYRAGARLETVLCTMISSPTLNIIVLTMMFSILPLHLALIKLGLTLVLLLIGIPLLARYMLADELVQRTVQDALDANFSVVPPPIPGGPHAGWASACAWVVRRFGQNLWYIVKRTVPAMFLAGLLGAAAITILPWDTLETLLPYSGAASTAFIMVALALFGLFLPVPMAFDVILVATLVAGGLPPKYSMILLFTLGIFSVYPFIIIRSAVSLRAAATLSVLLVGMGVTSGLIAHYYAKWDAPRQRKIILENFSTIDWPIVAVTAAPPGTAGAQIHATIARTKLGWDRVAINGASPISVTAVPFRPAVGSGEKRFTRHTGSEFGIERSGIMPVEQMFTPPFYRDWPIASGDVHGDGWPDLVLGSSNGIFLYANLGGERFEQQRIDIAVLRGKRTDNVALVDFDGDGLLDIFMSSYRDGNYILFNRGGGFGEEGLSRLPETKANLANAAAFADLDGDADIDILLGNWTAGSWTTLPPDESRNVILWNDRGSFSQEYLDGAPGETLSTLVSDINQDGYPDILVGNDFDMADMFYLGQRSGFHKIRRSDKLFPVVTRQTMSIDSADIDNDLIFEIYSGQVTDHFNSDKPATESLRPGKVRCDEFENGAWRDFCLERLQRHSTIREASVKQDPRVCLRNDVPAHRGNCLAFVLLEMAARHRKDPALCHLFPPAWDHYAEICRLARLPRPRYPAHVWREELPQVQGVNVLYKLQDSGRYVDTAERRGVDVAGWTWNAKFADIDNDQWQDLFVVNGFYRSDRRESNRFFRNDSGAGFIDETKNAGLENYLGAATYTYSDFDNDGDLDIILVSFEGPVWIYRNNTRNSSIAFELHDSDMNRFGIGGRVVIHYGAQGALHQIREIKSSGGFLSYDAAQAFFGLGKEQGIARVEVHWRDGRSDDLEGPFPAGRRYRITRR